jgi:DNA-binding response OmpR family regulator
MHQQQSFIRSVLVIDAAGPSTDALRTQMKELGVRHFNAVDCPRKARALVKDSPDLVLLETERERGKSLELLRMMRVVGRPRVVFAMGRRGAGDVAAELIESGADGYLEQPITADCVRRALQGFAEAEDRVEEMARWTVGRLGLRDALETFRTAMQKEAMLRTKGSARGTAALLDVDRHYIQRTFRRFGVPPAGNDLPPAERRQGSWPPLDEHDD